MQDVLVCGLDLTIGLRMGSDGEPSLTPQGVKVIGNFGYIKLPPVVKDHCSMNAETGYNISPDKLLNFGSGNGGNGFSFS